MVKSATPFPCIIFMMLSPYVILHKDVHVYNALSILYNTCYMLHVTYSHMYSVIDLIFLLLDVYNWEIRLNFCTHRIYILVGETDNKNKNLFQIVLSTLKYN